MLLPLSSASDDGRSSTVHDHPDSDGLRPNMTLSVTVPQKDELEPAAIQDGENVQPGKSSVSSAVRWHLQFDAGYSAPARLLSPLIK